ncbi:MAG TPA: nucleoside-diphosphate sugar epimerase/dehydratase [Bryobacteraceae bacterium]|nr:nucleoside-diphosphate sugar epimerase/dehydratase [Bryobacteraceae bacterium]
MHSLLQIRKLLIATAHLGIIAGSLTLAFLFRFDGSIPVSESDNLAYGLCVALPVKLLIFGQAGLFRGWWRYSGLPDVMRLLVANAVGSAGVALTVHFAAPSFPRTTIAIDFLLCSFMTLGARFAVRLYNEMVKENSPHGARKRILIYGAGAAGIALIREIRANASLNSDVVGLLDDDRNKIGARFMGICVLGCGRDAPRIVERLRSSGTPLAEIVIAMPSATGRQMSEAVANCRAAGLPCKTVPGVGELLSGRVLIEQVRKISIADLLGRAAVELEQERIAAQLRGRNVLVTGGAGSIGSELCRQIAQYSPQRLVIFDQAESAVYAIELELKAAHPDLDLVAEIGDIRELARVDEAMRRHSVEFVFHAAAYKHVPLMEKHVLEAVKNNVLGTWNVIGAARRNGVPRLLLISSDKAVNPSSVMGLTKRVTELFIAGMPRHGRTRFTAVRFGNVLGSAGSVIPLFQKQIASGGPVTVTHPQMRRYFMTTKEAVQLVLQASTLSEGSEIFVLEMGEPVRIMDLANTMVRLAGKEPGHDIEIRVTGLRPGEKLDEELMGDGDELLPTRHEKIRVCMTKPPASVSFDRWIDHVRHLVLQGDTPAVIEQLTVIVPEYSPAHAPAGARNVAAGGFA